MSPDIDSKSLTLRVNPGKSPRPLKTRESSLIEELEAETLRKASSFSLIRRCIGSSTISISRHAAKQILFRFKKLSQYPE